MTPAPVGHIFWGELKITGWRKDPNGVLTMVYKRYDGEIVDLWSMGTDDDGELVIKGAAV